MACNVLKCNVVLFTLWIIRSEITIFIFFKTAANKYKDKSVTLLLTDEIFVYRQIFVQIICLKWFILLFTERIHCIRMHIKLLLLLVLITYLYLLFQEDISNELLNDMESVLNVNKLDNILAGDNSLTWLWNRNKLHIPCCISESSVTWHKVMWPPVAV